jgi:small conductance mechanosensitive channel
MPELMEQPKVIGIVDFRSTKWIVRIVAKTVPLEQVKVETSLRRKFRFRRYG